MYKSRNILSTWLIAFVLLALLTGSQVSGQVVLEEQKDLKRIDVVEHLGEKIPLDLQFTDDHGDPVVLSQYFGQGKPVLLILGYYQCPMLCNLVFNGVTDGVNQMEWVPGEQFQIVTVSIDHDEHYELAAAKKENYLKEFKKPVDQSAWSFLVGDQSQSEALANALGFKYFYDANRDEYAHPAVVFVLSEDGTISRYLYGAQFKGGDLKLSLLEASEGKIGTTIDRIILYCFHYDPDAGSYVVVAGNVMKLGGLVTLVVIGSLLLLLWRGEKRKRRAVQAAKVFHRPVG